MDHRTPSTHDARVSMLTHDVRAAMSDVLGGLRLIDASDLSPELRAQIDRVRSSGEGLARLLEEALTGMYEAPSATAKPLPNLDLERFLHDMEMRWSGRAAANGLALRILGADDLPRIICVDRMAVDRILSNLLGNAIKYAGQEGVTLQIDRLEEDELRLRVSDDGPGFSDAALAQLFQFAGRPEGSLQPGTGLGLHIAKDLADRIGGRLSVSNGENGGAEITLVLPRAAWMPSHVAESDDTGLPDLKGAKILVAEDNETNQLLTGQMLEALGAEYEIAPNGVEALNWLEREHFDLALIDIDMPLLNGIDVIRAVRAGPGGEARLPLIALTAYVRKTDRDAIYVAGADGIIAKPIMSVETFGRAIADHMKRVPLTDASQAVPLTIDLDTPILDCDRMTELLCIAGPDTARELMSRLSTDLERVRRQLLVACPISDIDTIRSETHVLISVAGAIGARQLHRLAVTLNSTAHRSDALNLRALCRETTSMIQAVLIRLIDKQKSMDDPE
ncbi:MAG: two-component system aerobic respiration control sensor histidine kinase ArcB [Sulfitobacter sp.]|jgi:two-component system aerobic respiration control sensor histidine kinase ArcB